MVSGIHKRGIELNAWLQKEKEARKIHMVVIRIAAITPLPERKFYPSPR